MSVPAWIKKYPVVFFLTLSLLVHLCALSATVFWERQGGRSASPAVVEFDYYYEEEMVEEAEVELPSHEEEKAPEPPKEPPEED